MNISNIITIVIVAIAAVALIIFLVWKNKKDKKMLNPDAENSVEETIMNKERRKDRT